MDILQDKDFIKKINETLKNGGVISFVTDTVWGLGCLPSSEKAIDRIYEIKGRDRSKPLILMSNEVENLYPYVKEIPSNAKKLIDKHFPGALTLIFERSEKTPLYITSFKETVGIRMPANKVFQEICKIVDGHVLATTSANLSSNPAATTYEEAKEYIGDHVDYVFDDYGYNSEGKESTVALATTDEIKVLRQGATKL